MQIRYETMTHFRKNWQVRHGDQPWYHKHWIGVFVGTWPIHAPGAPCIKFNLELERERTKEEKEREEVLHLFRCYTHTHFVRACAVEMQGNISQEPLYTEIDRQTARAQSEHPDQAPAFTLTVRTSQCGHTVWGKTMFSKSVLWGKLDGPIWYIIYDYLPIYNWFSYIYHMIIYHSQWKTLVWFTIHYHMFIIFFTICLPYKYINNNIYVPYIAWFSWGESLKKITACRPPPAVPLPAPSQQWLGPRGMVIRDLYIIKKIYIYLFILVGGFNHLEKYESQWEGLSHILCIYIYLVGGIPTPLKNMKVSWDDDIPNIWKKNKPPICVYIYIYNIHIYSISYSTMWGPSVISWFINSTNYS